MPTTLNVLAAYIMATSSVLLIMCVEQTAPPIINVLVQNIISQLVVPLLIIVQILDFTGMFKLEMVQYKVV